jgi:hypothetical protein
MGKFFEIKIISPHFPIGDNNSNLFHLLFTVTNEVLIPLYVITWGNFLR